MGELLKPGSTKVEKELFNQFSELFAKFQNIDNNLQDLAVKNTNIKAYSLAFGPAATALSEMNAGSPKERQVMLPAYVAEISGLRLPVSVRLWSHLTSERRPAKQEEATR